MQDPPPPDPAVPSRPLQTVSLIGSYAPRRCGIGTFTADLAEAMQQARPDLKVRAVALNDRPEGYRYSDRVWFELNQHRLGEYQLAAEFLNTAHTDVVCLQHEFGIFGGEGGAFVLEMLRRLRMPVVATLHTVLRDPEPKYRVVADKLFAVCDKLVVMADRAVEFLTDIYGVPQEKIAVIPHGIPDVPFVDPAFYKDQFGVEGKKVILTFGLIGPSKGLENMIRALPSIVAKHPDAVYVIVGATHPGVLAHSGEEYRLGLQRLANELGVADHVVWFNRFVELDELTAFLGAADVYVTPYDNEAQITSGTLAYAVGAGKAVVSTPYWHASELLDDGRGRVVPFRDQAALASTITELFDHEVERHAVRKAAYQHGRAMRWSEVAQRYFEVFEEVRAHRRSHPQPASALRKAPADELTEIKLDHLRTLTDSCGLVAHAKSTVPNRRSGYWLEHNAGALIALLQAQDHLAYDDAGDTDLLVSRLLSFIDHAYDPAHGRFRQQMGYDRAWDDRPFSEDAHGRAMWALGETVARSQSPGHVGLASQLFHEALPACEGFEHAHGLAFSLIGIHAYLRRYSGDADAKRVRAGLAERLFERFLAASNPAWPYPNDQVTYAATRLPHALLLSGRWMFRNDMIEAALRCLDWLNGVQSADDGRFEPAGTAGGLPRGGTKARFDQLPQEAAGAIDANLEAYRVTQRLGYVRRARRCLDWFLGDNDLRAPLYDNTTGGCADRLTPAGASPDQGADATVSWLLSLLSMYEHEVLEGAEPETKAGDDATPAVRKAEPAEPRRAAAS
ncbi:MAG: glycosyltransferase family 4 protein [Planctomycetota bacterium]